MSPRTGSGKGKHDPPRRGSSGQKSDRTGRPGDSSRRTSTGRPGDSSRRTSTGRPGDSSRRVSTGRPGDSSRRTSTGRPGDSSRRVSTGRPGDSSRRTSTGRPGDAAGHSRTGRPEPARSGAPRRTGARPAPASPVPRRGASARQADRRQLGGDQIEGRQAVLELLNAGRRQVRQVWISEGLDPSSELDQISKLATRGGARVLVVPARRLDAEARTRSHQGVVAVAAPLEETSLDQMCEPATVGGRTSLPFILVLDGVTDPQNVGALMRTAECAGATGVVLSRHNAAHVTPTVAKVAAGAVEYLRMAVAPGIPAALARLASAGVYCIGLDAGAEVSIYDIKLEDTGAFERGVALVLGDEGRGLGSLTKKRCAVVASIPLRGAISSLNVASAGSIACFELTRRLGRE